MSIFSKKNILILVGIVLFLTFFTVTIPKEKSIGFEDKSIESAVVINGSETEVLEEGLADVFKSIGDITIKLLNWFKAFFLNEPDCNTCNCKQDQSCAEKCGKCGNREKSATEIVKEGLKGAGYNYYATTTCEAVGITGKDTNSLAACYAYSQNGYSVSSGGAPKNNSDGYANQSQWCCRFVKWAYKMAGKTISCYDGMSSTVPSSPKNGLLIASSDKLHIGIGYKNGNSWYYMHGNLGASNYATSYVTSTYIGTSLPTKFALKLGNTKYDIIYKTP